MKTAYSGNSNEEMSFTVVFRKRIGSEEDVVLQHGGKVTLGLEGDNTYFNRVGEDKIQATAAAGDGIWTVHTVTFDPGASVEGMRFFANSALINAQSYIPTDLSGLTTLGGATGGGTTMLEGDIAEVMKFTKVLNAAERIIVDNYLAAKYGLPLDANDVFREDAVERGNYDFDVAGIGRIDADNVHADARGRSIVRMLNAADLGDDEFLLWGHDNAGLASENTTDVPSGVDSRMLRSWRVSETSTAGVAVDVGAVEMRWDLTGQEDFPAERLRLLVDRNDNGSFSDDAPIAGAVDLGNRQFSFSGIEDLSNGRRFTLGLVRAEQAALPVKLVTFTVEAERSGKGARLAWKTSREVNSDHFLVERASATTSWHAIQRIAAAGNTEVGADYLLSDPHPLPGTSFYRLRQVDADGSYEYSPVVTLLSVEAGKSIQIFPNPAGGEVTVHGLGALREAAVRLYDLRGVEVTERVGFRPAGEGKLSFNVSALPPGAYFLKTPLGLHRVVRY